MIFSTVSVHAEAGPRCAVRVELAALLGRHIVGITPTGRPDITLALDVAVPDRLELTFSPAAALRDEASRAARAFELACARSRAESCRAHVVEDGTFETLLRFGRCSDLLVLGQGARCIGRHGVEIDLCTELLLHSGTPVLIVPDRGSFAKIGRRVLVAWKDTRESTRALRDALPILAAAEEVELLHVCAATDRTAAAAKLDATSAWIRNAGIASQGRVEVGVGDDPARLLDRAAETGADLVVMGGYGHTRAREAVLGGATRHVLRHMAVPTLMSH